MYILLESIYKFFRNYVVDSYEREGENSYKEEIRRERVCVWGEGRRRVRVKEEVEV